MSAAGGGWVDSAASSSLKRWTRSLVGMVSCAPPAAEQPFHGRQIVRHRGDDDMLEPGTAPRHFLVENVLADDDAGAAVVDLLAELRAGVDRAHRRDDAAEAQHREVADHELRAVEQVEGHPVALGHAELPEGVGAAGDIGRQRAVAELAAIEDQRRLAPIMGAGLVEQLRQGLIRDNDVLGHVRIVELQPGLALVLRRVHRFPPWPAIFPSANAGLGPSKRLVQSMEKMAAAGPPGDAVDQDQGGTAGTGGSWSRDGNGS